MVGLESLGEEGLKGRVEKGWREGRDGGRAGGGCL